MTAGRPRIPDSIKKLKGTFQACRSNADAPNLPSVIPNMPADMNDNEKKAWLQVCEIAGHQMQVLTEGDAIAIEVLARTLADYRFLMYLKRDSKPFFTTELGGIKPNPLYALAASAELRLTKQLSNFGMDPASRSKVSKAANDIQGEVDPYGFLNETDE